ncbi:uncharacterized protein LOC114742189 [Neltuma alba]|uniref:uncharacterized protein LOC114742189 n=1 Tax=Neltuma alba TaxID=207710 RepID=UPI0010A50257|nr:uncharacterized protein LOC114742189 [Prosopis alba]
MFKYLVERSEVLELGNLGQTGWKSLVPDIIPVEDEGMDNLIKLYLYEWTDIECLIDSNQRHNCNMTVFLNLIELHLDNVDVKELCWGATPSGFLEKLQILKLKGCRKLQNIFLDETLKLPHLRVLKLKDCTMFQLAIFKPSIAQSLGQLEELVVEGFAELKSLIADKSSEEEMGVVHDQKGDGSLFPALKSLQIAECGKLEKVSSFLLAGDLPNLTDLYIDDCAELKYIFSEYRGQVVQQEIKMLPSLAEVRLFRVPSFINIFQKCKRYVLRPPPQVSKEDSKERPKNFKMSSFSWAHRCCFLGPTTDTNIGVSNVTLLKEPVYNGIVIEIYDHMIETECLMRQPLSLQNIRQMMLVGCSKLKSLFSVSIATTIMLEYLYVEDCEELKHIITNEAEDDDVHLNCTSIFPKLQSLYVHNCNKLEFIFPSTLSGGLQELKSIHILGADELKYVFGKYDEEECLSNENESNEPHIHLPALESLDLYYVQNIISIGIKKRQPECPSLQIVEAPKIVESD